MLEDTLIAVGAGVCLAGLTTLVFLIVFRY